jgi:hypothetical protein
MENSLAQITILIMATVEDMKLLFWNHENPFMEKAMQLRPWVLYRYVINT